jgi:hypothetical protein
MKSRLATSIRCSSLYMNLGRRILVSTLLAVIVTAAAGRKVLLPSVRQKREKRLKPVTSSGLKRVWRWT